MNITGQPIYAKGQKPGRSAPIRNAARGATCTIAIPGVCRCDPAYTVGCHLRLFGLAGAAQKPDDLFIVDGCDLCHAVLDSRDKWADAALGWDDVFRALLLSQSRRRASGLIILKGEQ